MVKSSAATRGGKASQDGSASATPGVPVRAVGNRYHWSSAAIYLQFFILLFLNVSATAFVYHVHGWGLALLVHVAIWIGGMRVNMEAAFRLFVTHSNSSAYAEALRRADLMVTPITRKNTHCGSNDTLTYGASSMQGWRRTMEDAHTLLLQPDGGFFGVYDGHGGSTTSTFCGENMFHFVSNTAAFSEDNIQKALYDGFIQIDRHLFNAQNRYRSGCTAVVLCVKGNDIYCANAGDSRCVLCRDGEAIALSTDHKPFLISEQSRIERAGGYVINRRVNGSLALSRAIGDFIFKGNSQVPWDMQAVTSAPEVRTVRMNRDKDEFAVIACDGIWDVMSNEQVVEFVRVRLQQRVNIGVIAEQLMDSCLSPQPLDLGCDNMSVVIVQFKRLPTARKRSDPQQIASQVGLVEAAQSGAKSPLLASHDGESSHSTTPRTSETASTHSNGLVLAREADITATVRSNADVEKVKSMLPNAEGHAALTTPGSAESKTPELLPFSSKGTSQKDPVPKSSELDALRSAVSGRGP